MIKKSVFEQNLINGMQENLKFTDKAQIKSNLVSVVDYLHSAMDLLEGAGYQKQADKVLNILEKIARKDVEKMPAFNKLKEHGVLDEDRQEFMKGNIFSKARLNKALRELGYKDHQIGEFIGSDNVMSKDTIHQILDPERSFGRINEWLKEPLQSKEIEPGDVISFKSVAFDNSSKDSHTEGLTSDKMIDNLLDHGTVFNMAYDGLTDVELSDDGLKPNFDSLKDFEDD